MSKKRGLSLDRKQEQILKIFHESQSVFQLKELEKLGSKKGVVRQSVKDVVQTLVDDGLVLKDKIGSSVYFWSLPSSAGNQLRQSRNKLEAELESYAKRQTELQSQLDLAKKGREDSAERERALIALKELEKRHKTVKEDLDSYAGQDPTVHETLKNAMNIAHTAANRWTDNIFVMQQWCNESFPEAKESLEQMYAEVGIPEDLDYLEA